MPFRVSFSVSLCVSLAVSLMAVAPFIYRHCGVSLAVSLPVPQFVSRSVSQFGSQFGVSSMSPRHISHPSLGNGWVTCAGSIPRPMCHGQRRRAAVRCAKIGGSVRRENVLAVKRLRPTVSGGGQQLPRFIVANGVGRRRGGSAVPLWPTASGVVERSPGHPSEQAGDGWRYRRHIAI